MNTTINADMSQAEKNAAISARIVARRNEGMTVEQAIDSVLGSGTYAKMAGEIYDTLRAKAGKA